jgi:hypothetical protein
MPKDHERAMIAAVQLGRDAELDRLSALLSDDVPVLLLGEPGVGKTTLLRATAHASGRRVLEGGALSTLSWLDFLALERALGRPMVTGDATAVADDVEAAAGDAVLLLDDLQWAGAATREVSGCWPAYGAGTREPDARSSGCAGRASRCSNSRGCPPPTRRAWSTRSVPTSARPDAPGWSPAPAGTRC